MSILWPAPTIKALVLLAAVGVSLSAHLRTQALAADTLPPIGWQDTRSICASLCIAGLGGEPCGEPCATLTPRNVTQSGGGSASSGTLVTPGGSGAAAPLPPISVKTRRDACPLLCQYQLGEPLCGCSVSDIFDDRRHLPQPPPLSRDVDYHRICDYFCSEHNYHIYGCPKCDLYRMQRLDRRVRPTEMDIDWGEWCKQQCASGTGGVACSCDPSLPLAISISANDTDTDTA